MKRIWYIDEIEGNTKFQHVELEILEDVGGIHTRFYDEQGIQVFEIPQKLHKCFNEEYGIKLAYHKEKEMLYDDGNCNPAYEKTSPTAIEMWRKELNPETVSKGKLLFGYNLGFKIEAEPLSNNWNGYDDYSLEDFDKDGNVIYLKKVEGAVNSGVVPGVPEIDMKVVKELKMRKANPSIKIGNIAFIDLADFDDNLETLGAKYNFLYKYKYEYCRLELPKFNRYFNLPRILEHEFLGHVILKLSDMTYISTSNEYKTEGRVPVEAKLCNIIRREIGLPDRVNYTSRGGDFISIEFGYLNGSNDPDPNEKPLIIERAEGGYTTENLPPKYPITHGHLELSKSAIDKLSVIKYYKTIKYDVYKKTFNFK